jgi:hypothetical protein
MQGTPHNVDDVPPERKDKPTPGAEENSERQGPDPGPPDAPTEGEGEEALKNGPPPESIPGDGGNVPNPKQ